MGDFALFNRPNSCTRAEALVCCAHGRSMDKHGNVRFCALRCGPLRSRHRRHRLDTLPIAPHHQPRAVIAKRFGPSRMSNHARKTLNICRKPRRYIPDLVFEHKSDFQCPLCERERSRPGYLALGATKLARDLAHALASDAGSKDPFLINTHFRILSRSKRRSIVSLLARCFTNCDSSSWTCFRGA